MHLRIPAGPRRRTRRALLAAALPAALAAFAPPPAAEAASVSAGSRSLSTCSIAASSSGARSRIAT